MAQQAIVTPRPMPAARPRKAATPRAAAATTKDGAARETKRVASTAKSQAKQVKGAAVGGTKVVARTAEADARQLAGTVKSQARQVKGELAGQARGMLAETQGQLQAQADAQASRLAGALSQVGGQAVALSQGRPEQAGPLVDYAEKAATWLDDTASYLEDRGLDGLAEDVVDFARRRPAVFLAGAAVVGFGVGRLIRSGGLTDDSTDGVYGELEA
jgi:hypothetical protein